MDSHGEKRAWIEHKEQLLRGQWERGGQPAEVQHHTQNCIGALWPYTIMPEYAQNRIGNYHFHKDFVGQGRLVVYDGNLANLELTKKPKHLGTPVRDFLY